MADALRRPSAAAPVRRRNPRRAARADQFYVPRAIDNSRLVKAADPRERRQQKMLVMVGLLLGAAILAGAYQRFATIQAGYRLEALKGQREQLLEANRQLRLEEASLRDPERVDTIARQQLGLGLPGAGQVVHLEQRATDSGDTVLARAQSPSGTPSLKAPIAAAVP